MDDAALRNDAIIVSAFLTASLVASAAYAGAAEAIAGDATAVAAAVSRICGGPIPRPPTVLYLRPRAFAALLRKKYGVIGGSLQRDCVAVTAFYRPQKNLIQINSGSGQAQQLARTAAEIPRFRQMQLFHEFVHAWQFQRIACVQLRLREHPMVAQAMLEGQDVYCTSLYARENKILSEFRREQRFICRLRSSTASRESRVYFEFWMGYRFFRYMHIHAPQLTAQAMFANRLPTEKQIWFPDLYLHPETARIGRLRWLGAMAGKGSPPSQLTRINFLGFRRYLVGCGYIGPFGSQILRSYLKGASIQCGKLRLTALEFSHHQMAVACARLANLADTIASGRPLTVGHITERGAITDYFFVRSALPPKHRAVLLVCKGGLIWEAEQAGFSGRRMALRRWAERLVDRYMKIRRPADRR